MEIENPQDVESRKMGILRVNGIVFGDMPGGTGIAASDGGMVDISDQVVISDNASIHWAVSRYRA